MDKHPRGNLHDLQSAISRIAAGKDTNLEAVKKALEAIQRELMELSLAVKPPN
ncbi:MAG: hypothetical protein ACTHNH_20985 [Mesorhizobium sp.]